MNRLHLVFFIILIAMSANGQDRKLMDSEVKFDKGLFYYKGKLFTGIGITMWNENK